MCFSKVCNILYCESLFVLWLSCIWGIFGSFIEHTEGQANCIWNGSVLDCQCFSPEAYWVVYWCITPGLAQTCQSNLGGKHGHCNATTNCKVDWWWLRHVNSIWVVHRCIATGATGGTGPVPVVGGLVVLAQTCQFNLTPSFRPQYSTYWLLASPANFTQCYWTLCTIAYFIEYPSQFAHTWRYG